MAFTSMDYLKEAIRITEEEIARGEKDELLLAHLEDLRKALHYLEAKQGGLRHETQERG